MADFGKIYNRPKKSLLDEFNKTRMYDKKQLERDSWDLITKRISKEINSQQLAEAMLEMEEKYPGIGWKENAEIIMREVLERENPKPKTHEDSI